MKIILWNTRWAKPGSPEGLCIQKFSESHKADIVCYTEVVKGLHFSSGYLIESESDYGYKNTEGKRKVSLWSSQPWSDIEIIGHEDLPSGRFVSGVSIGIRFIGVCIPWRDAHVRTGRKDRKQWEDHLLYLKGLKTVIQNFQIDKRPICILGDFNQRIPRYWQPKYVYDQLETILQPDFKTETSGMHDSEGKSLIDHISVTSEMKVKIEEIHPKITEDGLEISDHVGIAAKLEICPKNIDKETVWHRIITCYSNLAMAHAAVTDSATTYSRKHYMIRSRLAKGLKTGTMKIGSLFDDEKEKMNNQCCCFCGSTQNLSVDHLLPRKLGGKDSGDNLILACRFCNSSKNKTDMLDWHLNRGKFPPLSVFRRYLKVMYQYCAQESLLNLPLEDSAITEIPFSIRSLPTKFPKPDQLVYNPKKK